MIILQRNDCENQLILKASSIFFNKNIHFSKVCIIQMKGAINRVTAFSLKWKIPCSPDFFSFSRPSVLQKV